MVLQENETQLGSKWLKNGEWLEHKEKPLDHFLHFYSFIQMLHNSITYRPFPTLLIYENLLYNSPYINTISEKHKMRENRKKVPLIALPNSNIRNCSPQTHIFSLFPHLKDSCSMSSFFMYSLKRDKPIKIFFWPNDSSSFWNHY